MIETQLKAMEAELTLNSKILVALHEVVIDLLEGNKSKVDIYSEYLDKTLSLIAEGADNVKE